VGRKTADSLAAKRHKKPQKEDTESQQRLTTLGLVSTGESRTAPFGAFPFFVIFYAFLWPTCLFLVERTSRLPPESV